MKPVLVLQNLDTDGPAYLGRWLGARGVPLEVRNTEAGDAYPESIDGYSALAMLGGEMSANDPLPSLRQAERLFLQALQAGVPTVGHCLGGQLMARALGARVVESIAPEIGWLPIRMLDAPPARAWFGDAAGQVVMQWHREAFELPAGATALATSDACPVQAFAIGPHLAMQFHIEIDAAKLGVWCAATGPGFAGMQRRHERSVQSVEQMRIGAARHLDAHQRLADRVYERWIGAVA